MWRTESWGWNSNCKQNQLPNPVSHCCLVSNEKNSWWGSHHWNFSIKLYEYLMSCQNMFDLPKIYLYLLPITILPFIRYNLLIYFMLDFVLNYLYFLGVYIITLYLSTVIYFKNINVFYLFYLKIDNRVNNAYFYLKTLIKSTTDLNNIFTCTKRSVLYKIQ